MIDIVFALTFVLSFTFYTLLRSFDVASTKAFAKYLDMDKHEVNPLINWLLKRGWSLDRSFNFMLFLFGVPIAIGDAALNTYLALGVPLFAWLMGCFHLVASINNYGYLPKLEKMKPEEIRETEANEFIFAIDFHDANLKKKIEMLWGKDGFVLNMTLLSVIAFASIYYTIDAVGLVPIEMLFFNRGYLILSLFNMGWILAFVLIAYYPMRAISTIVMIYRYYNLSKSTVNLNLQQNLSSAGWIDLPVEDLKKAVKLAEENLSTSVRIWLGSSD